MVHHAADRSHRTSRGRSAVMSAVDLQLFGLQARGSWEIQAAEGGRLTECYRINKISDYFDIFL